jgi:Putative MetA-pathway of phenol degradation
MKNYAQIGVCLLIIARFPSPAQTNTFCQENQQPTAHAKKLVCLLPNLGFPPVTSGPDPIGGLDAAIASQASLFPLASPASGIIFTSDPTLQIPVPSGTDSFGPVMFERGETLHRGKLFVAFTYQYFQFSDIDIFNLKDIPAYFQVPNQSLPTYVQTVSRVDLKINQFALYATYGLTNRIDVSVAVPILNVKLGATSTCEQGAQVGGGTGACQFLLSNGDRPTTVSDSSSASGIGDIVFRVKGNLWQGERFRLAAAIDVRAPTGDELDFLGTGTTGVRPFLAASWRGRIAPHLDFGYEWNGDSDIASIYGPGVKGDLANSLFYVAGADARVIKRLTVSAEYLGQHLYDGLRQGLQVQPDTNYVGIYTYPGSFYSNYMTIGGKVNPLGNLLLTLNGFFKLDHTGLRNKPAPLAGISYTF